MGYRGSEYGAGRGDLSDDEQADELSSDVEPMLPRDFKAEPGSSHAKSEASGNQIHIHGLTPAQGLAIAALAALALGITAVDAYTSGSHRAEMRAHYERAYADMRSRYEERLAEMRSNYEQAQAEQRSRYEQSYRELATKVALNTNATDDMRASLIARGINPNNHDITDVGGPKP